MFDFQSAFFWYKLIFVTELMVAEGFATYTLQKKKNFLLRVIISTIVIYIIAFLYPVYFVSPPINTLTSSVMFLLFFVVTIAALKVCFDENILALIFCGIIAYTTQHIAYATYMYILNITGIGNMNFYGDANLELDNPFTYIIYFGAYGLIYWFVWAFVEHKMREQEKLAIEPLLFVAFVAILFVDVVLSFIVTYYLQEALDITAQTVIFLYRLTSVLFEYAVLYFVLGKSIAESELKTVESLWDKDRRAFEFNKENIDLINIKVHDLKHQIRRLRSGYETIDPDYLAELENSVDIYDNSIVTGCEALDLLFAENSIYFAKHHIRLSVMADGAALSFMTSADIYSLFGNALHNAQEALTKVDEDKRIIRLNVRRQGRMVSVHVENYCNEVDFGEDGLPITDKTEQGHGYGMRSMRLVAEKYGGFLLAELRENMFVLDIVIPVSAK